MKRVLVVAYYFPPLGGVGSLRVAGFASYLAEFGWEPVVLAPRNAAGRHDPELHYPETGVVRTASLELSRLGKRALRAGGDDAVAAEVRGARAIARAAAREVLYFPDARVGWYLPAVAGGRKALRGAGVDAIFSSSFPITAHLVARRLARGAGVPWLADFRDPWSQMRTGLPRLRALGLERSLARSASALTMTSASWAERHSQLWSRPVGVLPNGHDVAGPLPSVRPEDRTLALLGTYYAHVQDLSAVWTAIAGGASVRRIRLIGDWQPDLAAELHAHGLADRVEATGFLPEPLALERLRAASMLLLPGPRDSRSILGGHFPAKTWQYLATDLPILYVGDLQADVARLLRDQPGCHLHAPDDVEGIARTLSECDDTPHRRRLEPFGRRARTRELAQMLDGLTG